LFEEVQQAAKKGPAVSALCQITGLNRAGFYRWRTPPQTLPVEMEIRDELQRIALESPAYGYRRITVELRNQGFDINHKRVLRMMREDNLLCVRRRRFVATTDSRHHLAVYPNLAAQIALTAINQLWVADITYIRLRTEFIYLAVVLDAFSRRVIGWALGRRWKPNWRCVHCGWPYSSGSLSPASCITRIAECSMLRTAIPSYSSSIRRKSA
jgi:hypothetical protein